MSRPYTTGASRTTLSIAELIQSAEALQSAGQHEQALDMYRQWLRSGQDEKKHLAWFHYGWLLQKLNKVDEATQAYDQLTANYADFLTSHNAPSTQTH